MLSAIDPGSDICMMHPIDGYSNRIQAKRSNKQTDLRICWIDNHQQTPYRYRRDSGTNKCQYGLRHFRFVPVSDPARMKLVV